MYAKIDNTDPDDIYRDILTYFDRYRHSTFPDSAALETSIKKWVDVRDALEAIDCATSASYCALCSVFISHGCKECPVTDRAGFSHCEETPYKAFKEKLNGLIVSARKEIEFLESLE